MEEVTTIGIDLAKSVFQVHGVDAEGMVVLRRQLRRGQVLVFFSRLRPCLIGLEACAGAHYWARDLTRLGHEVRLMPPSYVKAHVKRGKTDAADAEAICEAVTRPNMRFVPVKSEARQAVLMMHRMRDFLVRQMTQVANALRAHLGEFGIVAPKGVHHMERLLALAEAAELPESARGPIRLMVGQFRDAKTRVDEVTRAIRALAEADQAAVRLQTIPGIGPITASVLAATLPEVSGFHSSRDLAAWIGLTPKPCSSGGKERLGRISKMGNRYIRRLLYLGPWRRSAPAGARSPAGTGWEGCWCASP